MDGKDCESRFEFVGVGFFRFTCFVCVQVITMSTGGFQWFFFQGLNNILCHKPSKHICLRPKLRISVGIFTIIINFLRLVIYVGNKTKSKMLRFNHSYFFICFWNSLAHINTKLQ